MTRGLLDKIPILYVTKYISQIIAPEIKEIIRFLTPRQSIPGTTEVRVFFHWTSDRIGMQACHVCALVFVPVRSVYCGLAKV